MEDLMSGFNSLFDLLVWPYLAVFILLSYTFNKVFGKLLLRLTKKNWKPVYTVLFIATLSAIPFYFKGIGWEKILVTYAIGTSFYEVILKSIFSRFKS